MSGELIDGSAPVAAVRRLLEPVRTVAVVGCSPNPNRDSHRVAAYLQAQGFRIIPVNPGAAEILGEPCLASLAECAEPVDVVDVFRRPEFVPAIAEAAIANGAAVLWLQDGVMHEAAAERARSHGLTVVMDRCMLRDHAALARGDC